MALDSRLEGGIYSTVAHEQKYVKTQEKDLTVIIYHYRADFSKF